MTNLINAEPNETFMRDFMELFNFKNLKSRPIFKNPQNPCIEQQPKLFSR